MSLVIGRCLANRITSMLKWRDLPILLLGLISSYLSMNRLRSHTNLGTVAGSSKNSNFSGHDCCCIELLMNLKTKEGTLKSFAHKNLSRGKTVEKSSTWMTTALNEEWVICCLCWMNDLRNGHTTQPIRTRTQCMLWTFSMTYPWWSSQQGSLSLAHTGRGQTRTPTQRSSAWYPSVCFLQRGYY